MALQISNNFNKDIQSRDTNLVPVIRFGTSTDTGNNYVFISTISDSVDGNLWLPLLIDIPSLKESIDIQKRNYKIPSISIKISNSIYNGEAFSESISLNYKSFINTECRIYWVSPSAKNIQTSTSLIDENDEIIEDLAFQMFNGVVRRYSMTEDTITIQVEDYSQGSLHKDLPLPNQVDSNGNITEQNWTGSYESIPDKYKNKPIPFVYGKVNNSPLIIKNIPDIDTWNSADIDFICDKNETSSIVSSYQGTEGVTLFQSDHYFNVPSTIISDVSLHNTSSGDYFSDIFGFSSGTVQFTVQGNYLSFNNQSAEDSTQTPANLNQVIVYDTPKNENFVYNPLNTKSNFWTNQLISGNNFGRSWYSTTVKEDDTKTFGGTLVLEEEREDWDGSDYILNMEDDGTTQFNGGYGDFLNTDELYSNIYNDSDGPGNNDNHERAMTGISVRTGHADLSSFDDTETLLFYYITPRFGYLRNFGGSEFNKKVIFRIGSSTTGDYYTHNLFAPVSPSTFGSPDWNSFSEDNNIKRWIKLNNPNDLLIYARIGDQGTYGWGAMAMKFKIHGIAMINYALSQDIANKEFYADVDGRKNSNNQTMRTTHEIINNILTEELKFTKGSSSEWVSSELENSSSYESSYGYSSTWLHDFTVDEKINSKKLIEGLASSTPYIPRFNSMGNFKFDTIPDNGAIDRIDSLEVIDANDIIDFSFTRTPVEDVYTKIDFHYNWDYGLGKFTKQVPNDLSQVHPNPLAFSNYGLPEDHSESTLIIDDDRGKYIRDSFTATRFARWTLDWYRNQHLKIKIKLPLKYITLEVGEIIKFSDYLGNKVLPYGIDYMNGGQFLDGQTYYKTFQILSTNKTLKFVELEVIQLHQLNSTGVEVETCYDEFGACQSPCEIDECGICGGDNSTCLDDCGVIGGNNDCYGCMDENACNYDPSAELDSNDCKYETECNDCDGNLKEDADGDSICDAEDDCVGSYDQCGECNGNNQSRRAGCNGEYYCLNDPEQEQAYNSLTYGCKELGAMNYDDSFDCPPASGQGDPCAYPWEDNADGNCVSNRDCRFLDLCPEDSSATLNFICDNPNYSNRCVNNEPSSVKGVWDITGLSFNDIYNPSQSDGNHIGNQVMEYWENGCYEGNCDDYYPLFIRNGNCRNSEHQWTLNTLKLNMKNFQGEIIREVVPSVDLNGNNSQQVYLFPTEIESSTGIWTSELSMNFQDIVSDFLPEPGTSVSLMVIGATPDPWTVVNDVTLEENIDININLNFINFLSEWEHPNYGVGFSKEISIKAVIQPPSNSTVEFEWKLNFKYESSHCWHSAGDVNGTGVVGMSDFHILEHCMENTPTYNEQGITPPEGISENSSPCLEINGLNSYNGQNFFGCTMLPFIEMNEDEGLYDSNATNLSACIAAIINGEVNNCEEWILLQDPDNLIDCCSFHPANCNETSIGQMLQSQCNDLGGTYAPCGDCPFEENEEDYGE
tara:strand:+ start:10608 stop:15002 length:4395 start_codon:yes stop_codon:yes gene_type:complete